MDGHGNDGVDDWGSGEYDGHDRCCCSSFVDGSGGTKGKNEGEGTESSSGACDETPGDAAAIEGVGGATHFEKDGCSDADQGIGNADKKKGFQAGVRGLCSHWHQAASFVQEYTVDAPRKDGEKSKDDPIHISHGEGMRSGWRDLTITDYEGQF